MPTTSEAPQVVTPHPAKWSTPILAQVAYQLGMIRQDWTGHRLLDPFAGVGLDRLRDACPTAEWVGVELEPEWACQVPGTIAADATRLPFPDRSFSGAVTSPVYGNRMSDTYDGRDGSKRMTYRIALGRMPGGRSIATMQWGRTYRAMHRLAWRELFRVLDHEAPALVNISNHVRKGQVQHVMEWHLDTLVSTGFRFQRLVPIETRRFKNGANREARVASEHLIVMVRP